MSKLMFIHQSRDAKIESNSIFCESCGRQFETPIQLTNLSSAPEQTYNACPFCFSKLEEDAVLEDQNNSKAPISEDSSVAFKQNLKEKTDSEQVNCPHYFGYLKKRPKNTPIPDTCLTCEKMIKCVL